jgi:hypothetical protein
VLDGIFCGICILTGCPPVSALVTFKDNESEVPAPVARTYVFRPSFWRFPAGTRAVIDALLTAIGVLGLGALLISMYVFAAAARRFVSDGEEYELAGRSDWVLRSGSERRRDDRPILFPITINGQLVPQERREGSDRRRQRRRAAA